MPITLNCHHCGKPYQTKPAKAERSHFCSFACRNASYRKPRPLCEQCGKPIPAANFHGRYCSFTCSGAAHTKERRQITCQTCGKVFWVLPSEPTRRFCSKGCAYATVTKACAQCGKTFASERSGHRKYCSPGCFNNSRRRGKIQKLCVHCGAHYETFPSNRRSRFCSPRCKLLHAGPTSIEIAIGDILEALTVSYVPQKRLGPWVCDFFLPDASLVIECDGVYWHSKERAKNRDARKNAWLSENGYRLLRLPEMQIRNDLALCRSQILTAISLETTDSELVLQSE